MADSYVCSGAIMVCSCGTTPADLTVFPSRTIYLTGQPMANISDHIPNQNIHPFGLCTTCGNPVVSAAHGTPQPCIPMTLKPWQGGKGDYLIKDQPALLKSSTCQCKWGGVIRIIDDGQHGEGTQWVSKSQEDEFDKEQDSTERVDVNAVLDGIQIALDVAGFVPGFGAISDLTNAAISALRGNWAEAGMSVLAAVPIIGDAAAGVKIARRGYNITKMAKKSVSKNVDVTIKGLVNRGMSVEEAKAFRRAVRNERKKVARDFYENYSNIPKDNIESHLLGIDFTKPIKVDKIPPVGQKEITVYQYRNISINTGEYNKFGNYFTTNPHATPSDLGIADVGVAIDETVPGVVKGQLPLPFSDIPKERFVGTITEEVPCLRSTARGVDDNWSVPGQRIYAKGGGEQLFIPNNSFASKMIMN